MQDKLKSQLIKFKYPLIALTLGLVIMLIPIGTSTKTESASQTDEQRLEQLLEHCKGVGDTYALLSENGAVIVCRGAEDPEVRLAVTMAVEAFTGFSSDRIRVLTTAQNIGG